MSLKANKSTQKLINRVLKGSLKIIRQAVHPAKVRSTAAKRPTAERSSAPADTWDFLLEQAHLKLEECEVLSMATKELSVPFRELARLEVYCAKCGAALLLDLTNEKQLFGNVEACPVCMERLPERLKAAITAYARFFTEASVGKSQIAFRVTLD